MEWSVFKAKSTDLCRSLSWTPRGLGHSTTFPENTSSSGSCTEMLGIDSFDDLEWESGKSTSTLIFKICLVLSQYVISFLLKSSPFCDKLVQQCKQLSGIVHRTHAVLSHLSIIPVLSGSQTIPVTSPFLGKDVPDVDAENAMELKDVNTADILWEMKDTIKITNKRDQWTNLIHSKYSGYQFDKCTCVSLRHYDFEITCTCCEPGFVLASDRTWG